MLLSRFNSNLGNLLNIAVIDEIRMQKFINYIIDKFNYNNKHTLGRRRQDIVE